MDQWLNSAKHVDLHGSRGNGPFGTFKGVILHVNVDEHGTSDSFFKTNSGQVTPNFQVYKDGSIHQYLPFDWQPWCQINGNFNYAAIETAGMPDEALTAQQCASIALILKHYHSDMGLKYQLANKPGDYGLGTHKMGGGGWGGHNCPGTVRTAQRGHLLDLARGSHTEPHPITPPKHVVKLERAWPRYMTEGDYFGLITGPDSSHGGYTMAERSDVKAIQLRLQQLRLVSTDKNWADGRFEYPTARGIVAFHKHYMPHVKYADRVYENTWDKLFTY